MLQSFTAGDDGVARLIDPPTGVVFVMASAPGHVRSRWTSADTRGDEIAPVTIALEPGIAIDGEVVDAADGRPVAGAALDLRNGAGSAIFGDPPLTTATSDEGGRFTLDGAPKEGGVTLLVTADGYARARVELRLPRDARERIRVELTSAATLRGQVVTQGGAAVARATVRVMPADRTDWIESATANGDFVGGSPPWLETRTGPDGAFTVDGLTLERAWVALALSRDNGVTPLSPRLDPRALPDDLVLTLPASARLAVHVLDDAGRAIDGARVRLGTWHTIRRRAETDTQGRFVFDGLAAGTQDVRVEATGRLPRQLQIELTGGGETVIDVQLERGATVAGVVVDASGAPVAGAEVAVRGDEGAQTDVTDGDGRFAVAGVAAGPVRVGASGDVHAGTSVRATAPADGVRLVLERLATVTWRVRLPDGVTTATGNVLHQVFRGTGDADPVSGVNGWSRRTVDLDFVDGIATITWTASGLSRAVVYTNEFAPVFAHADPKPGEQLDLGEVTLGPGRTVRGRVEDDARRPVAGARVVVRERPTSKHVDLRTGDDGTFELTQLGDGPVPFAVSAPGHGGADGTVAWPHDGSTIVVTLARLRRVTVHVLDARGEPRRDADVAIHRLEDGREREAYGLAPDEDGRGALVADLHPAVYRIRISGGPSADVDATGEDDPEPVVLRVR